MNVEAVILNINMLRTRNCLRNEKRVEALGDHLMHELFLVVPQPRVISHVTASKSSVPFTHYLQLIYTLYTLFTTYLYKLPNLNYQYIFSSYFYLLYIISKKYYNISLF